MFGNGLRSERAGIVSFCGKPTAMGFRYAAFFDGCVRFIGNASSRECLCGTGPIHETVRRSDFGAVAAHGVAGSGGLSEASSSRVA
jgi:hypothetical protein